MIQKIFIKDNEILFKSFLLFVVFLSYFFGFFFRENIAGGAEGDFLNHAWPVIKSFEFSFVETIKNYGKFGEGSWPMFHILNAFLNPFTHSQIFFQFSITLISLLNFFIFENIIRGRFNLKRIDSLLFSSVILLLPFFRSSAFWGINENFGWLFLLLAIKYYFKIPFSFKGKNLDHLTVINVFLLCFFSSLALYTRQYLIFFTIFFILDLLFVKKNFKIFYLSLVFLVPFSIPGLMLIYTWGGFYDSLNFTGNLVQEYHHPKYILRNLPFLFSFFAFYLFPFFILEMKKLGINKIFKKYYLSFFIYFITIIILIFLGFFDFLEDLKIGGGALLKIDYLLFNKSLVFFALMSSLGFCLLFEIIKQNSKFNLILFFSLFIFCFPQFILQEYYEPLVIFLYLLLFNHSLSFIFKQNINFSHFVIISYFTIYLLGSFYYRYFLFA